MDKVFTDTVSALDYIDRPITVAEVLSYFTLEQLHELEQADKEGRLLVLPCPIGKTVYVHRTMCDTLPSGRWNSDCMYIQDCPRHGRPCPQEVRTTKFTASMYAGLGKTFWLTGEDAEAAIPADRRNKKNGTTH